MSSAVAHKNQFALLDDDTPESQHPVAEATPETSPDPNATSPQNKAQRGRGGPASRGGRYYQRGGAKSTPTSPETNEEGGAAERPRKYDGDSPRGRGRGRGGRGRGGPPKRGREFDRQSGTLPDSEKRVHQGWGGDDGNRELQNEEGAVADATAETVAAAPSNDWADAPASTALDDWAGAGAQNDSAWDAAPADAAAPAAAVEPAKDADGAEPRRRRRDDDAEDDNTMTLEQYLAQQKEAAGGVVPKLEVRKANEGADDNIWKNAVQVDKSEGDSYFVGKTKSAPKARAKKAEKEFIEIEPKFERPNRGGRGRGGRGEGRGEGRGGGGRGRGRGDRNPHRAGGGGEVDVDDQSAFPSLS